MISPTTQENIENLLINCDFRTLCDNYFADKFDWTIKGSSVLSGVYDDKERFFSQVINRLSNVVADDWKMHLLGTYIDGDVMIIEMRGEVKAKSGSDYNNDYCWIFHFNHDKVAKLTAYYDSLLVNKTLEENQ